MKEINERVRDSKTILRLQKNEFQKQKNELEKCYNSLNDSLYHYKKSHNDMQSINQSVDVNDVNGIEKLKRLTEMRKRELEKSKQNYALDLEKTNQRETVRNFYKLTELCETFQLRNILLKVCPKFSALWKTCIEEIKSSGRTS